MSSFCENNFSIDVSASHSLSLADYTDFGEFGDIIVSDDIPITFEMQREMEPESEDHVLFVCAKKVRRTLIVITKINFINN